MKYAAYPGQIERQEATHASAREGARLGAHGRAHSGAACGALLSGHGRAGLRAEPHFERREPILAAVLPVSDDHDAHGRLVTVAGEIDR